MVHGIYVEMKFNEKLKTLIETNRLSQQDVADHIDVAQSTIGTWIKGTHYPRLDDAAKLSLLFGVPIAYLADDSLDEPIPPLDEDQRMILRVASTMSVDEALARLTRPLTGMVPVGKQAPTGKEAKSGLDKVKRA